MLQLQVAREEHAVGHALLEMARIGAAADGERLRVLAGDAVVHGHQLLHQLGALRHMVRMARVARLQHKAGGRQALCHGGRDGPVVKEDRIAAVKGHRQRALAGRQQAQVQRQRAGHRVAAGDAHRLARAALGAGLVKQRDRRAADAQLPEHGKQHLRGVLALFRGGRMRRHAGHDDLRVAADQLRLDRAVLVLHVKRVGGLLTPVAGQHGHSRARHDVRAGAAGDGHEALVRKRRVQLHLHDALLRVDQREVRVRGEAHRRQADLFLVVFQILHAALLVAAQDQAAFAPERDARIEDRLHREQRGHTRALVVAGAAADQTAIDDLAAVGIVIPAVALGHHVQVRQHSHGLVTLANLRVAAVAVDVARLHAQSPDVRHRGIQRAAHLRAKGRFVRAPVRAHARHANPALQRFNHVALERRQRRIQLFIGFEFHRSFPLMLMFKYS